MSRVGWLADKHDPPGGAELTQAEFRAAAPEGVEVVDWTGDEVVKTDRWVIHNCRTYSRLPFQEGPSVRYLHDLRGSLAYADELIFCSPAQMERYRFSGHLIPPALNLKAFRPPRQHRRNGERNGTCCVGAFMNPGKGGHLVAEWGDRNEPVDVYGYGPFLPAGPHVNYCGPLEQAKVAQTLWQYERFVFLPTELEPFGRCVVEAWAAGCELIVNGNVGARYWIEEAPEKLESAAVDFWGVVCESE